MILILPAWPVPGCLCSGVQLTIVCGSVWCTTRVDPRAGPISSIHPWSATVNQTTSTPFTRLRWWHKDIYRLCRPTSADCLCGQVSTCVDGVSSWVMTNRLLLNVAKPKSSDALLLSVSISTSLEMFVLTISIRLSYRYSPSETWEFTSTLTLLWGLTSSWPSNRALQLSGRSVAYDVPASSCLTDLICAPVVKKCNLVPTGISGDLMDRIQSVLNDATRLIFSTRRSDDITPLLHELQWLRVPERIQFRLCVLAYCFLHGIAPPYLTENLHFPTDVTARCRLRSVDSLMLFVPPTQLSSLGDRAFPVTAPRAWNILPNSIRTAASLPVCCRDLKALLFRLLFNLPFVYISFVIMLTVSSSGSIVLETHSTHSTEYVKCYCNVFVKHHLNHIICNHNNNNNNNNKIIIIKKNNNNNSNLSKLSPCVCGFRGWLSPTWSRFTALQRLIARFTALERLIARSTNRFDWSTTFGWRHSPLSGTATRS